MIIAVTESNRVYALDAHDGRVIWQRPLGLPVASVFPAETSVPLASPARPLSISPRDRFCSMR